MKLIGAVLASFYAIVSTAVASSPSRKGAGPAPVEGTATNIDCSSSPTARASVSKPSTTVSVTCAPDSTVKPPASADAEEKTSLAASGSTGEPSPPVKPGDNVYIGADCTQPGVLSSVCPGATVVTTASGTERQGAPNVNVFIPQLPASAQVVCLKCSKKGKTGDCTAVISVAAALPQGPQACAVPGSSVTLAITEAGDSAQFACGANLTLMPSAATKAYADDCTTEETLKDMSRSAATGNYVTFKVDKLKKKKVCYLCKPRASGTVQNAGGKDDSCKIYVEVSGSTRPSSTVRFGAALACVAAVLRST